LRKDGTRFHCIINCVYRTGKQSRNKPTRHDRLRCHLHSALAVHSICIPEEKGHKSKQYSHQKLEVGVTTQPAKGIKARRCKTERRGEN